MKCIIYAALLVTCLSSVAQACRQIPDRIVYEGKKYWLNTPIANSDLPLDTLDSDSHSKVRSGLPFDSVSTGCYRGYIAWWKVEGGILYLTRLSSERHYWKENGESGDLEELFPDRYEDGRVKADWFCGELVLHEEGRPWSGPTHELEFSEGEIPLDNDKTRAFLSAARSEIDRFNLAINYSDNPRRGIWFMTFPVIAGRMLENEVLIDAGQAHRILEYFADSGLLDRAKATRPESGTDAWIVILCAGKKRVYWDLGSGPSTPLEHGKLMGLGEVLEGQAREAWGRFVNRLKLNTTVSVLSRVELSPERRAEIKGRSVYHNRDDEIVVVIDEEGDVVKRIDAGDARVIVNEYTEDFLVARTPGVGEKTTVKVFDRRGDLKLDIEVDLGPGPKERMVGTLDNAVITRPFALHEIGTEYKVFRYDQDGKQTLVEEQNNMLVEARIYGRRIVTSAADPRKGAVINKYNSEGNRIYTYSKEAKRPRYP